MVARHFAAFLTFFSSSSSSSSSNTAHGYITNTNTETVVGIDLGTTYSCVGAFMNGKVDIIPNDQGNRITPSYVAFMESGDRLIGDRAKNQATLNPENTVFGIKRIIGRKFSDPSVQSDMKFFPYKIIPDDTTNNDRPMIQVLNGEQTTTTFTPEEISAMILQKMKSTAEDYLGKRIHRAVVTVPAYFNDVQRQATKDAGIIAGLEIERIINEPTAAAIAYGMNKVVKEEGEINVLVFDLGGGTFDVTILTIENGVFEVKATSGDTRLGGEDIDQRIMQYYINIFQKENRGTGGLGIVKDALALQKLRKEVERVKRVLSSQQQARLEIENLSNGFDLSDTLTRARFEEINKDLFQKTLEPVRRVLDDAKLRKNQIDDVLLVGGSTRIPKIRQILSKFFGKPIKHTTNPEETVAYGAAIQGAVLSGEGGSITNDVLLVDIAPISKGVETIGGEMIKIFPRGTTIPTKKSQTFSTFNTNQRHILIKVYEGEKYLAKDNNLIGKFELSGIPAAPRGVPQIEVTFSVDTDGILQVSVGDDENNNNKIIGSTKPITIASDKGTLTKNEIDRMVQDAKNYAKVDHIFNDRIDALNELESYLFTLNDTLHNHYYDGKRLSIEDRQTLQDLIHNAIEWVEQNTHNATKIKIEEKLRDAQTIADNIIFKNTNNPNSEAISNNGDNMDILDYNEEF